MLEMVGLEWVETICRVYERSFQTSIFYSIEEFDQLREKERTCRNIVRLTGPVVCKVSPDSVFRVRASKANIFSRFFVILTYIPSDRVLPVP